MVRSWIGWSILCGLGLTLGACSLAPVAGPPVPTAGGVRFTVALPAARTVAVSGSFNDWSVTAHPMSPAGTDGLWTVIVPLPPGEFQFMYVVNGEEWLTPPQADDYVADGFGQRNGVVVAR